VLALGVRKIWDHGSDSYSFTHFHPADFSGVLTSIDSVPGKSWREREGIWPPAGRDWREHRSAAEVVGLSAVTIQARNKEATAKRWGELLAVPVADGSSEVKLSRGTIRFTDPIDADGTGVVAVDIEHKHPGEVLRRARTSNLPVQENALRLCGVAFNLLQAA
jgi:hypothetical protein